VQGQVRRAAPDPADRQLARLELPDQPVDRAVKRPRQRASDEDPLRRIEGVGVGRAFLRVFSAFSRHDWSSIRIDARPSNDDAPAVGRRSDDRRPTMATAFLGPRGTFSEDAALSYAGPDAELLAMTSIPALSAAVETGLAADAVVPIENSIEGSVSSSLDLLIHETDLRIKAELVVPVRLFLITPPGATLTDIKVVSSHPNPLGQSRRFLERILPRAEQVAALSTAAAVEEVVASGDYGRAAIGTESAAALFGGRILAHDIQTSSRT
jgi:hypothetical protein